MPLSSLEHKILKKNEYNNHNDVCLREKVLITYYSVSDQHLYFPLNKLVTKCEIPFIADN